MLKEFQKFLPRRRVKTVLVCGWSLAIFLFVWGNVLLPHDCQHIFSENYESIAASTEGDPVSPQTSPSPSPSEQKNQEAKKPGYHIYVNLDSKQLYVYKDGVLVKTYPCSGGKASTPSPEGTWKIISKDTWGEGFGGSWMGFNVPWGKYGIHGTDQPWFVGRANESQGCIRMVNKDAAELYKMVPHGTTVTIVQEHKTFRLMMDGDIGSDVRDLQKALHSLGYYQGGIDGRYGRLLIASVQKFQRDHKLNPTGRADRRTFDLISQKVKELKAKPTE